MKDSDDLLNELEKLLAKSRKQRTQSTELDAEIARVAALVAARQTVNSSHEPNGQGTGKGKGASSPTR